MMRSVLKLSPLLSFLVAISGMRFPKDCPFPLPKLIEPCSCSTFDGTVVDLSCNLEQDVDADLFRKLVVSFGSKNKIRQFNISLNGYQWLENFSPDWIGKFQLSQLQISDFESVSGNFYPGAFQTSVEQVTVSTETEVGKQEVRINAGTFENLPNLKRVELRKSIAALSPGAFKNLPKITEINLSNNSIKRIEDDTFVNLPSLQKLDLSGNSELCHIGKMFNSLGFLPDLYVNLAGTNVNILLEEVFKPFLFIVAKEKGMGKGIIDLAGVPLLCGCDVKWVKGRHWPFTNASEIFANAVCQDGTPLDKVDFRILENWCPPSNTSGYDAGYGQMYPRILESEDIGSLSAVRELEMNEQYQLKYFKSFFENYTISAFSGPISITFEDFYIGPATIYGEGYLRLTGGDGALLLDTSRPKQLVMDRNFTSTSNTVHVEFSSPVRYCNEGEECLGDKFKLKWQGQGGIVDNDRNVFCECCK